VVLPIASKDPSLPFIGMAVHFLFGNVVVLHPGFTECWFGWRVAKIFPAAADLEAHRQGGRPDPDLIRTGRQEQIRFWISGALSPAPRSPVVKLSLTDAETEAVHKAPSMAVDAAGHLVGLRRGFLQWLEACGLQMPASQREKALWPEPVSPDGLDAIGRALATFYLQSAYGGKAPVDPAPFETAVEAAPSAFMSHDLLGWALYRNGRHHAARAAFDRSIRINAHGAGAMAGLMWCAVVTANREEALHWAERKAASCAADVDAARAKAENLLKKYADPS
jgi:hypothetical protein